MLPIARWRELGLELAFDPDAPPAPVAAPDELAAVLAHLDAEQLVRVYPRDPDGRLPLDELVLLSPIDAIPPPRLPKQLWLVARGPSKRSAPQVVTLALQLEIRRNAEHEWDAARWLWDTRAAGADEMTRWGTTALPIGELVRGDPPGALPKSAGGDARAAHAIRLVRAGRWREALAACGVTHGLDPLPYAQCNHGSGVEREIWDRGLDERMARVAPWRFAAALAANPRSPVYVQGCSRSGLGLMRAPAAGLRLFNLPGQTTSRKHAVMLRDVNGAPHLSLGITGSNERLPARAWQWPPDLVVALRGGGGPAPAPRARAASSSQREDELLAQIAASPGDDEVRRVYADLLADRGDARGEMITLQLAPAAQLTKKAAARIRALQRAHARAWLGPLGPLVDVARLELERGFAVRCVLGGASTPFDAWAGALTARAQAELASVRGLELAAEFPIEIASALLARPLPALTRLVLGSPALLGAVSRPVPELEIRVLAVEQAIAAWRELVAAPATALRVTCEPIVWPGVIGALLSRVRELRAPRRLAIESGDDVLVATPTARGWRVDVTATRPGTRRLRYGLPDALEACASGTIDEVVVHAVGDDAARETLRVACAAHARQVTVSASPSPASASSRPASP